MSHRTSTCSSSSSSPLTEAQKWGRVQFSETVLAFLIWGRRYPLMEGPPHYQLPVVKSGIRNDTDASVTTLSLIRP